MKSQAPSVSLRTMPPVRPKVQQFTPMVLASQPPSPSPLDTHSTNVLIILYPQFMYCYPTPTPSAAAVASSQQHTTLPVNAIAFVCCLY